ncbi:MarR family winged helix-turn-helix transcriptional regulator [Dethiothermospora halolimnae]|uniref:MarR family winged helix-turn-helix transcriptional regulator n=1 Tax=Dethiothermospora halolimnae TaxID=3114390 RepID=UPI003CCC334D
MNNESFDQNIIEIEKYLRKTDHIIRKKGREILKDFNITGPQFVALQWLISDGELTIGELSQKLKLACSTITDLIDRMEKNKLVTRTKDKKDKRVVRIRVNEEGHELVKKVLEKRRVYIADKLKDFDKSQKEVLKESLETLYMAMKESNK